MPIDPDTLMRTLLSERGKLLAYLRSLVRRRELAEDVFQDVCVLALQHRERIVDAPHLSAWIRTAARLTAMNVLRKRQNRQGSLDDEVLDSLEAQWEEEDAVAGSDRSRALAACLDGLSERARQLLRTRYADGLSVTEIARQAARPANSMYVTFSRIHGALADCIMRRLAASGGGRG